MEETLKQIQEDINNNQVVLYLKGTALKPMCGFSYSVVNILQKLGVNFKDINVLSDPQLREAIKIFTDWPTIPQLYVAGEFIGGCDIVKELYESEELEKILEKNHIPYQKTIDMV